MLNKKNKILVTGSEGYLARFLIQKLNEFGVNIILSNRSKFNLLDKTCLEPIKNEKVDYIIHAAVVTHAAPFEIFELNNLMNINILQFYRDYFPDAKFVGFGTSASYPENLKRVEENYLSGEPEKEYEQYAISKRNLLYGLKALYEQFGMQYLYFIPSCLYGEGFEDNDHHFIYDLIRKICNAKYRNEDSVKLFGDGGQIRDLIYIHDAVDIIIEKMINSSGCEILNVTSGNPKEIKEYAALVCGLVGYDYKNIAYDFSKDTGIHDRTMYNKINFRFTPVKIGLKRTIEYYVESVLGNRLHVER